MGPIFFTVLTPTYNRAHTLPRVYASLLAQAYRNFEWVVVDDGSADDTCERVLAWQQWADFPIRYVWQPNQHKKAAFNHGVVRAAGTWVVALDSDDALLPDTLQSMADEVVALVQPERYFAVTGLCARPNGNIVGDLFPTDGMDASVLDMVFRYRIRGEKFGCMRTAVLRAFPFPESLPGFVPESLVWRAIARAGYLSRHVNQVYRIYHDSQDALSHQGKDGAQHALGLWLLAHDTLAGCWPWFRYWPAEFLRAAARHVRFGLHVRRQRQQTPPVADLGPAAWCLRCLMWPVGLGLYLRDRRRADTA